MNLPRCVRVKGGPKSEGTVQGFCIYRLPRMYTSKADRGIGCACLTREENLAYLMTLLSRPSSPTFVLGRHNCSLSEIFARHLLFFGLRRLSFNTISGWRFVSDQRGVRRRLYLRRMRFQT
jgi:hypothetical protein